MIEHIELAAMLPAAIAAFVGGVKYGGHRALNGVDPAIPSGRGDRSPHQHEFNTVFDDGKGWRCGVRGCGKLMQQ